VDNSVSNGMVMSDMADDDELCDHSIAHQMIKIGVHWNSFSHKTIILFLVKLKN
jgi:hypothetical protein